jgi:hypothetical protein
MSVQEKAYFEAIEMIKTAITNAKKAGSIAGLNPAVHKRTARLLIGSARALRRCVLPR